VNYLHNTLIFGLVGCGVEYIDIIPIPSIFLCRGAIWVGGRPGGHSLAARGLKDCITSAGKGKKQA